VFAVIPSKAGIQYAGLACLAPDWISAFAGMTMPTLISLLQIGSCHRERLHFVEWAGISSVGGKPELVLDRFAVKVPVAMLFHRWGLRRVLKMSHGGAILPLLPRWPFAPRKKAVSGRGDSSYETCPAGFPAPRRRNGHGGPVSEFFHEYSGCGRQVFHEQGKSNVRLTGRGPACAGSAREGVPDPFGAKERAMMSHIRTITKRPVLAQDQRATLGQMLTVAVEMLRVLATAMTAKGSTTTDTSTTA